MFLVNFGISAQHLKTGAIENRWNENNKNGIPR